MARIEDITITPLMLALAVNGQVRCDCGHTQFFVAGALNMENGNNFVRMLECAACRRQMAMVHKSDANLAPSIVS